jgi:hypothetical protein
MIATLELDDRRATVWFEQPRTAASSTELARLTLTPPPDPGRSRPRNAVTGHKPAEANREVR